MAVCTNWGPFIESVLVIGAVLFRGLRSGPGVLGTPLSLQPHGPKSLQKDPQSPSCYISSGVHVAPIRIVRPKLHLDVYISWRYECPYDRSPAIWGLYHGPFGNTHIVAQDLRATPHETIL